MPDCCPDQLPRPFTQRRYLTAHPWEEEVIESFLPTLLISLLAITVPLLLLLIAKKAHTITTLSALHDRILIRYYKWLILNVLVFFCVGTAALQSFLVKFKNTVTFESLTNVVTQYWPSAGPFYVGWRRCRVLLYRQRELTRVRQFSSRPACIWVSSFLC